MILLLLSGKAPSDKDLLTAPAALSNLLDGGSSTSGTAGIAEEELGNVVLGNDVVEPS